MKAQFLIFAFIMSGILASGSSINVRIPLYKQCDSRWAGLTLAKTAVTVCQGGSLVCSLSAALAGFGKTLNGQIATPETLLAWLKASNLSTEGYSGFTYDMFKAAARAGLQMRSISKDAKTEIYQNKAVFLNVDGKQWMLATSYNDDVFTALDCKTGLLTNINESRVSYHISLTAAA